MNVLELFSGIGGMHFALKASEMVGEVIEAIDINTTANQVYIHNFPSTKLCQKNVQSITPDYINERKINLILMSPPCQPFTRLGKKLDMEDSRCAALKHFIELIPHLGDHVKYILLENVKGFESSDARQSFVTALENTGFNYKELLLSPQDLGFPNSRSRYYLLAKRQPLQFPEKVNEQYIYKEMRVNSMSIADLLEISDSSEKYDAYILSDNILSKRAWLLDIVSKTSKKSCCFTRGYTHYVEGTGSVYCPFDDEIITQIYNNEKSLDKECCEEKLKLIRSLRLRFFTPREVANLLCFPEYFSFPNKLSTKQKYRLLGNSINVKVVANLIRLLCSDFT